MQLKIWNRYENAYTTEMVYGGQLLESLYSGKLPKAALKVVTHPLISYLYGQWQDTGFSREKVPGFIRKFGINMQEYVPGPVSGPIENSYQSFNQFFIRQFRPGMRPFQSDDHVLSAFAEGRYIAKSDIDSDTTFPVKGKDLNLAQLLMNEDLASEFEGGGIVICRLCPLDYHRFHFPSDCEVQSSYRIKGELLTVNPIVFKNRPDVFLVNERQVSILNTPALGKLAYIEVGATMVGKIVQSHPESRVSFKKGEEKGYFLFGGSTVVLLFQKNQLQLDSDLVEKTAQGEEVFVKLGDQLGVAQR